MRYLALLALALIAPSPEATAGEICETGSVVHHFLCADQNQDGTLARAEYERASGQNFGVSFETSDANADGEISMTEYIELYDRHYGRSTAEEA